jgi:ferrous iron transport protein A
MLQPGYSYVIEKLDNLMDKGYRLKLLAMGFVPGAHFKVIRKAPLGDMLHIVIQGTAVSLRAQELAPLQFKVTS